MTDQTAEPDETPAETPAETPDATPGSTQTESGIPNPETGVGIGAGEPSTFEPEEDAGPE